MTRRMPICLAAALALAPLGARAADLVVWWQRGLYPQEDAAVREIVAGYRAALVELSRADAPASMSLVRELVGGKFTRGHFARAV